MFDNENFNVFRDGDAVKEKQKVNRTKLPRRAKNFSKEQLQLALRKKKECNAKAQKIVETLLDPVDDVDQFLVMLRDINQSHFDDVVQERAIQKICGYPLCLNELVNIPQQKYVISLSNKKVYDITERKNFCSGDCYKASNFVKEQMLTSPLWLRDQEDIPEFRLLNTPSQASLSVQTTTTTVTKIEISQEPTVEINIDELRIVEKTYPASSSKGDQNDGGRRSIQEGSEVDLSIRESESSGNSNEADEKDSLSDCIKKCL
ncbi:AAEL005036-PA [Aedes aegypti]|uniref:RNA polymerase II subunit B1 CTD phosphatase RPAP2 homolog n=2 Tax=Aedes aegypti TaxID=7159 RepID=A0A1S4F9M7_AEDAE|nr:putative RNA polymerase II subunit B1 CTD phosphatase RPAP2 homolog [Aedes aegypti]EAT43556.1 AAEL005036-PA [Aedes aegypti]